MQQPTTPSGTRGPAIRGPAIFLAQFLGSQVPFDNLPNLPRWASSLVYSGTQLPTLGARCLDLRRAAESQTYCDDLKGLCAEAGVELSERSTHLQGQLVAVHPAFDG